jgi:hypothetical protein
MGVRREVVVLQVTSTLASRQLFERGIGSSGVFLQKAFTTVLSEFDSDAIFGRIDARMEGINGCQCVPRCHSSELRTIPQVRRGKSSEWACTWSKVGSRCACLIVRAQNWFRCVAGGQGCVRGFQRRIRIRPVMDPQVPSR